MPDLGGLGPGLAGEKISLTESVVLVQRQLGEGGFSFVYLVKDITEGREFATTASSQNASEGSNAANGSKNPELLCLKITSIHSRQQRDIAEKEAKLLSRLSHPSIIKMMDACYRSAPAPSGGGVMAGIVGRNNNQETSTSKSIPTGAFPQHLILMEYCEGGHALDVCNGMHAAGNRFDLPSLIIAFGQICNAVSYLHAQRPPIVHRDLKPVNFLVKNGAYKLCDFGSAVFGHVELKTSQKRQEAQEVIEKTTTQMFRAPEMVDLYMAKKLTQSTDVWALGCCLYSLAYFQNCFEEGSNLAILSRNYKIPDDNPYGPGLAELIDRMLTTDYKARCDMTEVILCLSALYSGNELPPRKERSSSKKTEGKKEANKVGTYRTDGQGIRTTPIIEPKKKISEAKKLNPNSAAARRRRALQSSDSSSNLAADSKPDANVSNLNPSESSDIGNCFEASFSDLFTFKSSGDDSVVDEDIAFSTTDNPFASFDVSNSNNTNSSKQQSNDDMWKTSP